MLATLWEEQLGLLSACSCHLEREVVSAVGLDLSFPSSSAGCDAPLAACRGRPAADDHHPSAFSRDGPEVPL